MSERKKLFRFKAATAINTVLTAIEFASGWISASSALIADSFHVAIHTVILTITVFALSRKNKNADVLGSKMIALLIIVLAIGAYIEAMRKIITPAEINSGMMLGVSIFGLLVNLFVALFLWSVRHSGESAKAYWLCLRGDIASSGAAIGAAALIHWGGNAFTWTDPMAALAIAIWLFCRSIEILCTKKVRLH